MTDTVNVAVPVPVPAAVATAVANAETALKNATAEVAGVDVPTAQSFLRRNVWAVLGVAVVAVALVVVGFVL